jgi:chorismate--pyruvate lyase
MTIMTPWQATLIGHPPYRPWLTNEGSLTQALRSRCPDLRVLRLRQGPGYAYLDERPPLGLPPRRMSLIRDVLLTCAGRPLVYAHSVIPLPGLTGPWRMLSRLGNRPLGEALFADPLVQRHPLRYRRLDRRHPLYDAAIEHLSDKPPALWARRSIFARAGHPILVTEVFLPEVLRLPPLRCAVKNMR